MAKNKINPNLKKIVPDLTKESFHLKEGIPDLKKPVFDLREGGPDLGKILKELTPIFPNLTIFKLRDYFRRTNVPFQLIGNNNITGIRDLIASYEILQTEVFEGILPGIGLISGIGSGILIKPTIFLTAGHCAQTVANTIVNGNTAMIAFNYQSLANETHVSTSNVIHYSVKEVMEIGDDLDYGLLKIKPVKKHKIVDSLDKSVLKNVPTHLNIGEEIVVVGHPGGSFTKGSLGKIISIDGSKINHDADTLGTSSGSPIFLTKTGKMIGVHTSKYETEAYNFGIKMLSIFAETTLIAETE